MREREKKYCRREGRTSGVIFSRKRGFRADVEKSPEMRAGESWGEELVLMTLGFRGQSEKTWAFGDGVSLMNL